MPNSTPISALSTLLPSFPANNKPFPPLLISQSESLLAQSRQRAPNLKPEEEIARPHACAEIACNRLRAQLRLPAIKNGAGAPCNPRVYAKLIKFLEGVLSDAATGSLTPRGRKRDGDGNVKNTPGSQSGRKNPVGTPSKLNQSMEDTPTKKRVTDKPACSTFAGTIKSGYKKAGGKGSGIDDKAPDFVMPSIRELCKLFATSTIAPHVYTGTCIVLRLAELWSLESEMDDVSRSDILALVTALYLMVLTRMQREEMTTEVYTEISSKAIEALKLGETADEKVEKWIDKLNDEGWCNGEEWWESVPESVIDFDLNTNDATTRDAKNAKDEEAVSGHEQLPNGGNRVKRPDMDEEDPEGVLLPGLGTMLHDGIDWTSEDKQSDYEYWKSNILKQIGTPFKASGKRGKTTAAG